MVKYLYIIHKYLVILVIEEVNSLLYIISVLESTDYKEEKPCQQKVLVRILVSIVKQRMLS